MIRGSGITDSEPGGKLITDPAGSGPGFYMETFVVTEINMLSKSVVNHNNH
jgi:hypothetical protein